MALTALAVQPKAMASLDPDALMKGDLSHLRGVIDLATVVLVLDAVWEHLAARDVHRADPSTWPSGAVYHLQPLKRSGALRALATEDILGIQSSIIARPTSADWTPLIRFPEPSASWRVPHKNWHLDEPGRGNPAAHRTARLFVLLSDQQSYGGGTLAIEGSAGLVRRVVAGSPDHDAGSSTDVRRALQRRYEWFELLLSQRDACLDARLLDGEEVDGVFCRVIELTGAAGDVWCMDQWTLHNASTNASSSPRIAVTLFASG